jgi:hypothetical protein
VDSEQYSVNSNVAKRNLSVQDSVDEVKLATAVRTACVQAALAAYEDAAMSGLCHEGAWECAVDAMRSLNVGQLVAASQKERLHV